MRQKIRPRFPRLGQNQREYGKRLRLEMRRQMKSLGQQRLHHQAHLIFRRITIGRARLNVEALVRNPPGQMSHHGPPLLRRRHDFVSERDVDDQRESGGEPPPRQFAGSQVDERVPVIQREIRPPKLAVRARFHRCDFKRYSAARCDLPFGNLRLRRREPRRNRQPGEQKYANGSTPIQFHVIAFSDA